MVPQHHGPQKYSQMLELASSVFIYDIFICFRGEDTRAGFSSYLYNDLLKQEVRTFFDEYEIQRGSRITLDLPKAIEKSRFFIIVFSANFAYSQYCLDELVKILEEGRLILPVFYMVKPCHLRHLKGSYGRALAKHAQKKTISAERLGKWTKALREVSDIRGWHITKRHTRHEFHWISSIVEEVTGLLRFLQHTELESQVDKLNSLLNLGSDDQVHMVGICGTIKIPILTLARRIFDLNAASEFDGLYILDNVRENSYKYGLVHLQKMLLYEILRRDIKIGDVNEGILKMKDMLRQKKLLLVLHKVGKLEELQAALGKNDCLGSGSIVIITTQEDRSLLHSHGIERIYNADDIVQQNEEHGQGEILPGLDDGRWDPMELEQQLPPPSSSSSLFRNPFYYLRDLFYCVCSFFPRPCREVGCECGAGSEVSVEPPTLVIPLTNGVSEIAFPSNIATTLTT